MTLIILAIVGIGIALAGCVYLARLMYFKKAGELVKAEIISAEAIKSTKRTGVYEHTLRYTVNGKAYEEKDKAGYSEPMKAGTTQLIFCDPKDPKKFKFEQDIDKHIRITAVLIGMGLVMAGRFLFSYMK